MLRLPAALPDAAIGLGPALARRIHHLGDEFPVIIVGRAAAQIPLPRKIQRLTVNIELHLTPCVVPDADRPAAAIPLEGFHFGLAEPPLTGEPINEPMRPRRSGRLLVQLCGFDEPDRHARALARPDRDAPAQVVPVGRLDGEIAREDEALRTSDRTEELRPFAAEPSLDLPVVEPRRRQEIELHASSDTFDDPDQLPEGLVASRLAHSEEVEQPCLVPAGS